MNRLRCLFGRHSWRTIRIEGQTAYECRHCDARDFERPRGADLDDLNEKARHWAGGGGGGMSGGGGG
jgi:hypothetical protein